MSKINVRSFSNENEDGAPDIVGVSTFSATSYFVPTRGTTEQRPSDHVEVGSLRYNYDTKNLEYYRGHTLGWSQFELIDPELGGGTGSNTGLGTRAVIFGGYITGSDFTNTMDFVTISTLGNAQDFGDSIATGFYQGGAASRTRGYMMGGQTPGSPNGVANIDTMVFSSTGNATDYGDLTQAAKFVRSISNSTRAVANLGSIGGTGLQNVLEYINMDSTGSTVDFGDLTNIHYTGATTQSSIRGFFQGGQDAPSSPYYTNMISAITTASLGTYEDWGDLLTQKSNYQAGFGNATRGIDAGGADQPYTGVMNTIQYYSVVTAGNAVNFGDLNTVHENITGTSDSTRGLIASGQSGGSSHNVIEYIQISTTGDAKDFGDLTVARMGGAACSNAHGGL